MTTHGSGEYHVDERQALFNAATIIRRIALRFNRHPATRAVMLEVASGLRDRGMAMLQKSQVRYDDGGWAREYAYVEPMATPMPGVRLDLSRSRERAWERELRPARACDGCGTGVRPTAEGYYDCSHCRRSGRVMEDGA